MGDSASTSRVSIGRYELEVGAPAGTLIVAGGPERVPPADLAHALREKAPRVVESAGEATARVEDGVGLVKDVLDGVLLDPQRAVKDVDLLLELFERLVKEGRLSEALRLARTVNGALALLMRWATLVRTLRTALCAAEKLGDKPAIAWAHHELGTLHLAAEIPAAAQQHLEQARTIRRELGDAEGLAATEHNLVHLCRQLRDLLRDGRFQTPRWRGRRALLLAAAMTLFFFVVGAVAAALVKKPHDKPELIAWVQGQGRVVSAPQGIACDGGRCDHSFDRGQAVTLTARPRYGSRFVGWSGDCRGRGACRLVLDHTKGVTARFAPLPNTNTVHVHKEGDGRVTSARRVIDCGTVCTTHAKPGTRLALVARPGPDATFVGWSGPCSGTGACEFTVHGDDVTVTARFAPVSTPESTTLTVRPAGTGSGTVSSSPAGIRCGRQCVKSFPRNSAIDLTATAADGSRFVGWNGACTGAKTCRVTLTDAATVIARFDKLPPPAGSTLTVRRAGDGTVSSSPPGISCGGQCTASFPTGTAVVLTPTAGDGSRFAGWSGACQGSGPCKVDVRDDTAVGARFVATHTLTASSAGPGSLSPACSNGCVYDENEVVTVSAIPASNAEVLGWSGCTPAADKRTCTVTMSADQRVSASFDTIVR
jgi:uncharacterized repeat protein (TIGR02543 family)